MLWSSNIATRIKDLFTACVPEKKWDLFSHASQDDPRRKWNQVKPALFLEHKSQVWPLNCKGVFLLCMHYSQTCLHAAWWWITYTHYENCTCSLTSKSWNCLIHENIYINRCDSGGLSYTCVHLSLSTFVWRTALLKLFEAVNQRAGLVCYWSSLRNVAHCVWGTLRLLLRVLYTSLPPQSLSVFRFFTLFVTSSPVQPYLPVLISPVLLRQSTNLSFLPFTLWIMCLALISTCFLSWNLYSFFIAS